MAKTIRQIVNYILLVFITVSVVVWPAAAHQPTADSPDILSLLRHLTHIGVTLTYYPSSFGGIAMYKNKDPTSDPHFLFNDQPRRFRAIEPDLELVRLENELRQRNLLYQPEVQWLLEIAASGNDENSRWTRNQLKMILESERIQDIRAGPEFRPLAPAQLLSQGELHLLNQVDGTSWKTPKNALTRGMLVTGPQGGGKTRFIIWLCQQLNAADPPIPWFVIDPKLELRDWAKSLGAIYIDTDDPEIGIDMSPPPGLTYETWLPSLAPQFGEIIGVIYGIEVIQQSITVSIESRKNFIKTSGRQGEICLLDLYHAVPFVQGVSSGRRSGYKDAVTTGLSRILSGSGNLFKCRKGIDLSSLFNRNVILGTRSITDEFAARFLALYLLWYLHESERFSPPSDNPKSALIIDDASRYIGPRTGFDATRSLSSLGAVLATLRSTGRAFVAVSQVPHMIDPSILALCHTILVVGGLQHSDDTRLLARMMSLDESQRAAVTRLGQREAIAVSAGSAWPGVIHGFVPTVTDLQEATDG